LAIPTTLHDSLMARLDRLTTAKVVTQLGATLGRQFAYDLLQAVSPLDEATLQRELARLVEAEILYQRGVPPQATYIFKHALIQDSAYQSLLKSTRQQYHQLLGDIAAHRDPSASEQAEAYYQQALTLTEELGMRPLQAHCHRSLGTLYAKTGQREQGHAELSIAIELYKAMDMTFWLPQAEAALVQVEGQ
jgi:predicted ATPase